LSKRGIGSIRITFVNLLCSGRRRWGREDSAAAGWDDPESGNVRPCSTGIRGSSSSSSSLYASSVADVSVAYGSSARDEGTTSPHLITQAPTTYPSEPPTNVAFVISRDSHTPSMAQSIFSQCGRRVGLPFCVWAREREFDVLSVE
jgi:hypothetical protein